jgi:hypothetical protein
MGDPRRFHLFAKMVQEYVPSTFRIADVAGGKGYLQSALRQLGYTSIVSWDRRPRYAVGRSGYRYGWFDHRSAPEYDAIVAMHPDEGTDHAIMYAVERGVIAIVCPCCTRPHAVPYWGDANYAGWREHLWSLASRGVRRPEWRRLKMNGRNDVLIVNGWE